MKIEQKKWTVASGWVTLSPIPLNDKPNLVLLFGGTEVLKNVSHFDQIRSWYPTARIISASTAGEIMQTQVSDDSLVLTAIKFEKTKLQFSEANIERAEESEDIGKHLARALPKEGLVHAMVFSDGLTVNGTSLVKGLLAELPKDVSVTGGLVGDGALFKETLVGLDNPPATKRLVCVGFYGSDIKIGYGSLGGWDPFGITRTITKSKGNILYELDGVPALKLYKEYLGNLAKDLPGSGLLFPLSLNLNNDAGEKAEVVRTLLAIDEQEQSMTFAGDMPEGISVQFMKANFDRLVEGASVAADMSTELPGKGKTELAILISCVGRKLVLKERIEEEVEAVQDKLGKETALTGFYSYGEICPTAPTERQCRLHNQTMTITTFREL